MATTTNYGWTTPDDTALVKDGAAAIRTLGSSADTTVKGLNPGTTAGDIDYYTTSTAKARVGIGSSGQALTVVAGVPSWAASPTSVLTTTGDSLYASAANTLARLGIGTTGQVLTVAAGLPSWANAPASIPANSTARVDTYQSTTSTSYTDLATSGPAVTITTGTRALVIWNTEFYGSTAGRIPMVSPAISGASTVAASNPRASVFANYNSDELKFGNATIFTGLTAGSNTFTLKYRVNSGTANFGNREIIVIDMGS
jgi:hypothetical protein